MRARRNPKIYSTLRRRFGMAELQRLGFVADGSRLIKRGACRRALAVASADGLAWRVTPLERNWKL